MILKKLTNIELETNLKRLIVSERKILHVILSHIQEVETRRLYLAKAYSSLYEYLVKECGYSGAAAMRRISAARLMREVPAVAEKIQAGTLNLSQVSELSRAIKEKEKHGGTVSVLQKEELVFTIAGKTTQESQKEIALNLDLELKAPERTFVQKDDSVHMQITLTQEQYQKLLKCRDLASSSLLKDTRGALFADVIGILANQYLAAKGSKTYLGVQTDKKAKCSKNSKEKTPLKTMTKAITLSASHKTNRTLTPKTRRAILNRDLCCQFKNPDTEKVCGSTFMLEIDHQRPRWADGNHAEENLQVLCKAHNGFKYHREMNLRLL